LFNLNILFWAYVELNGAVFPKENIMGITAAGFTGSVPFLSSRFTFQRTAGLKFANRVFIEEPGVPYSVRRTVDLTLAGKGAKTTPVLWC